MHDSYFLYRELMCYTEDGLKTYNIKAGLPQVSVLGTLLSNIMYGAVLTLPIPAVTQTIDFTDDLAVVIVAKYLE